MKIIPNGTNELTISGNIKSIEDSTQIKEAVSALKKGGATSLILKVQDSFSMTSTVIGFLMKQVNSDKMSITMIVGDPRLYQLLEELSLVQPFNIRLVEK
jgi:hypothetical protein